MGLGRVRARTLVGRSLFPSPTNKLYDFYLNSDLPAGEYLERFEITFTAQALSVDELESNSINVLYANDTNNIVISNPQNLEIESVKIINMIGQVIMDFNKIDTNSTIELNTKNLSSGTYILNLETEIGEISKKVLVK